MTADEIMAVLGERGLRLERAGDELRAVGPPAEVTEAVRLTLRAYRRELWDLAEPEPAAESKEDRYRREAGPPLDWRAFRERLERFWYETGWTPVGGWKAGERDPRQDRDDPPAAAAAPAAGSAGAGDGRADG